MESRDFSNPSQSNGAQNSKWVQSASSHLQLEEVRKQTFSEAATQLLQLYNEAVKVSESSYNQGKEDAYHEILKWLISQSNADFKHVPISEFFNYLNDKIVDLRSNKTRKRTQPMNQPTNINSMRVNRKESRGNTQTLFGRRNSGGTDNEF